VYYLNDVYFSTYCHATSTKIVNSQLCEENLGNTVRELCSRKFPCMCYQQKISLPSLCTPQQTHKLQVVCNRYWCEASCHFSLQMLGHKITLYQGASLGTNAALSMVPTDVARYTYLLLGQAELLLSSIPTLF